MYKVMIVEDEILVRMGLTNSVQWDRFNMFVSSEAVNGQVAWEIFQSDRPEVIITDLRMPIMDGMSLIKKIREVDKQCRIIILTCIEEFEIARKAIVYDVTDYILKLTMTWDDIEKVLSRVKDQLDTLDMEKHTVRDTRGQIEAEKQRLLEYIAKNEGFDTEVFGAKVSELLLPIQPKNLVVCIISIYEESQLSGAANQNYKRIKNLSIYNMISENFKRVRSAEVFCENEYRYVIIFNVNELDSINKTSGGERWKQELREDLEHIGNVIGMYLNARVISGVSSRADGYDSLRTIYDEASSALDRKFFNCSDAKTYFYGEEEDRDKVCEYLLVKIEENILKKQIYEIKGENDINLLKEKIAGFLNQISLSPESVRRLFYKLGCWTVSMTNMTEEEVESIQYSYMSSIFKCDMMDKMLAVYTEYLDDFEKIKGKNPKLSREIKGVLAYINKNYMQNMTLCELAQKVNISQGYLSSVFKKEMGTCFSDYLLRVRINKSKELLVSTYLRLYEISESVGFSDYSYFSRAFKKITGVRPQKYRELWGYTVDGDEPDEDY